MKNNIMKSFFYFIKIFLYQSLIFFLTYLIIQSVKNHTLICLTTSWIKPCFYENFVPCCPGLIISTIICVHAKKKNNVIKKNLTFIMCYLTKGQ